MNDFLKKFQGRLESLGKDGVDGLMKNISKTSPIKYNAHYNINNNNNVYNNNTKNNSSLTYEPVTIAQPYTYKYNTENNTIKDNSVHSSNSNKQLLSNAGLVLSNQIWYNNLSSNNSPYVNKKNQTLNKEYDEHYNRIRDRDYTPYTIKDYKKICECPIKMGKLGPNLGTAEWNQKKDKMSRLMEYSKQVNERQKRISNKHKYINLNQQLLDEHNQKVFGSKRYKCVEYGKDLNKRIIQQRNLNLGMVNEYNKDNVDNEYSNNVYTTENKNEQRNNNNIDNLYLHNINMLRNSLI
jgi:hypothetical protein